MAFKNLTPLHCLPFDALTPEGEAISVVIVKLTLDLFPAPAQGLTHALKLSQEQQPLSFVDTYHGPFLKSSLRWESDLAPFKPRCDLVVLGEAHAPEDRPRPRFQVGVKLKARDQERPLPPKPPRLGPGMPLTWEEEQQWEHEAALARARPLRGKTILDKHLQITGARQLRRRNPLTRLFWWLVKIGTLGLVRRCPWRLTRPKPVTHLPLLYEYSFGGHVQAQASAPWARHVPLRHCLPGTNKHAQRQAWRKDQADSLLAEAFWPANPVGRGFAPAWYLKAAKLKRLDAPQIEDPSYPFTAKAAWQAMAGKRSNTTLLPLSAQGFGLITRNWEPRLRLAGTWDEAWVQSDAPYPPDFARAFNNVAHPDLQCDHLGGDEEVELTNLCPRTFPGVGRDAAGNQRLSFQLPGLYPYLLVFPQHGDPLQIPALLDTVILEPERGRVTLLQRASYAIPAPVAVELRMAMPGCAPAAGGAPTRTCRPPAVHPPTHAQPA